MPVRARGRRIVPRPEAKTTSPDVAQWAAEREIGLGIPDVALASIAVVVVVARALGWYAGRLAAFVRQR
jgi:hypothetical protein